MAVRTPCLPSEWLSELYGAQVWLKCENLQHTGSFKIRGALAKLPFLSKDERLAGVLCASAGNHGKGLAWAAKQYGVRCTVCVPKTLPLNKEKAIKRYGAQLIKTEFDNYDDTQDYAIQLAQKTGRVWVSPFDDPHIQAGNGGTLMLEILDDIPKCDALVLPVGGGGMLVGAGVVAKAKNARAKIFGVNTDASPGMWQSWKEKKAITKVKSKATIAEGLEGGVSESTYKRSLDVVQDMLLVKESHLRKAVAELLRRHRMAIEGSAAVTVAAMMDGLIPKGFKRMVVLLSGSNIDASRIKEIAEAHL
jgi:threonine dehydratase